MCRVESTWRANDGRGLPAHAPTHHIPHAPQTTKSASEEKRLLGSKRLNRVREGLVKGVAEIRNTRTGSAVAVAVPPTAPAPVETHVQPKAGPAASVTSAPPALAETDSSAVGAAPKTGGPVDYCGQKPTEAQVKDIATIRSYLSALSEEDKTDLSSWIDRLTDVRVLVCIRTPMNRHYF